MAENSKIEWTTHTFNPWWGCTKVGPECDECYAESFSTRVGFSATGSQFPIWGKDTARRFFGDKHWNEPLKWEQREAAKAAERPRIFCASMADVFEEHEGLNEQRWRLWKLIEEDTPSLDWMLLTKRPQNIRKMVPGSWMDEPRKNVWYGATVGVRKSIWRIKELQQLPAAIRFLSCEPLLEDLGELDLSGIDLVICGGESGGKARPMHPIWARSLRDQCQKQGVAFFFKQWGEFAPCKVCGGDGTVIRWEDGMPGGVECPEYCYGELRRVGKKAAGRLLDGRTWDELPQVQQ